MFKVDFAAMLAKKTPLVVAYGVGVDSTAMLVGFHQRGIVPSLILTADTGSERPETYAYLPVMQAWLASVGFPPVVVVKKTVARFKNEPYTTLEGNCLSNKTLPSLAFGRKACSLKWKREPQDKFCKGWTPAREAWARGEKLIKAIGYDAGPKDSRRAWSMTDDGQYKYWYPLRDWGWDREECKRQIAAAGLPVPEKSACFFCPATQVDELAALCQAHPDLARRIVEMERLAMPGLKTTGGLWRSATKAKPAAMADWIAKHHPDLAPDWVSTPKPARVRKPKLPEVTLAMFALLKVCKHRSPEVTGKCLANCPDLSWKLQEQAVKAGWLAIRPGEVCPWERYYTLTEAGQAQIDAYRAAHPQPAVEPTR